MLELDNFIIPSVSGRVCYPHPLGLAATALPHTTTTPNRTSSFGDPFLFRAVEAETYERGLVGAFIEETRHRRSNLTRQYPINPQVLEGSVNVAVWHYRDLDLVNATLPALRAWFDAKSDIYRDPGMRLNHVPWRQLFNWVYVHNGWHGGVAMPSAAGNDLVSIVVPRGVALDSAHFECEKTEPHDIPTPVIEFVLGLMDLPDGWAP